MNKEKILQLSNKHLYDDFIEKVLSSPIASEEVVDLLEKSERFTNDFIFRIHVQTAKQFIRATKAEYEIVIDTAEDLIERSEILLLPELLCLNYHILGLAYKLSGYFERTLECFFKVLEYERKYHLDHLTAIVYFYIGEVYMLNDVKDLAITNITSALDILEKTKDHEPRYARKKLSFIFTLFPLLYNEGRYEEMERHLTVLEKYAKKDSSYFGRYSYYLAKLLHHASRREFEEAKKVFKGLYELEGENKERKIQAIKLFLSIFWEYNLDLSYYEKELQTAMKLGESTTPYINYEIYKCCYEYFEKKGDRESAFECLLKSFHGMEGEMTRMIEVKGESFRLIEKNISIEENISSIQKKNNELKLLANEAERNKEIAESALRRLAVVSELGKKLTKSLDVNGIIDTVYEKLKQSIPMDTFCIVIKAKEEGKLYPLVCYKDIELGENKIDNNSDEEALFLKVLNTNKPLHFQDDRKDSCDAITDKNGKGAGSVLYLPLGIDDKVLGVCRVQHSEPNIYNKDHREFLEELMPYLSIALNNAFKSEELEKEVIQHKATQDALEKLNHRLELLSYSDSLTQISNRRDFENRIMGYLSRAKEKKEPIAIFMFDIDNFKFFNDTYGHLEGDKVLKAVALTIQKHFDQIDGISARFGGEEFVAACIGFQNEEVIALGEAIKNDVYSLDIENKKTTLGRLTISIGISFASDVEESDKSMMMRWADISLYEAKRTGKNKVVCKIVEKENGMKLNE